MRSKSLKLCLLLGAALVAMNGAAFAGPGVDIFRPLKSKQELSALKPGTRVAHECPHCGTITVSKVGKDQAHAEGFSCPECKMKITYRDSGSGKAPQTRLVDCIDVKTGKKMSARVCAVQK